MSGEWDTTKKGRVDGYVYQPRLISEQPIGFKEIVGRPYTRTRNNFWEEDILQTAILMRDIFPGSQQGWEVKLLSESWEWFVKNKDWVTLDSFGLDQNTQLPKLKAPLAVLLNVRTVEFFASQGVFKMFCDSPVAFAPPQMIGKMTLEK